MNTQRHTDKPVEDAMIVCHLRHGKSSETIYLSADGTITRPADSLADIGKVAVAETLFMVGNPDRAADDYWCAVCGVGRGMVPDITDVIPSSTISEEN